MSRIKARDDDESNSDKEDKRNRKQVLFKPIQQILQAPSQFRRQHLQQASPMTRYIKYSILSTSFIECAYLRALT